MNKESFMKNIIEYFEKNGIEYHYAEGDCDTIVLRANIPYAIGGHIETRLTFHGKLYCRSYFGKAVAHNDVERVKAERFLCYLNNIYFQHGSNNEKYGEVKFDNHFYYDEEKGNIFNGSEIAYDKTVGMDLEDIIKHILDRLPWQLADVGVQLVPFIQGEIDYEYAKLWIRKDLVKRL